MFGAAIPPAHKASSPRVFGVAIPLWIAGVIVLLLILAGVGWYAWGVELQVQTNPPGAQVFLDGEKVGSTPADGSPLVMPLRVRRGLHNLRISLAGYYDITITHYVRFTDIYWRHEPWQLMPVVAASRPLASAVAAGQPPPAPEVPPQEPPPVPADRSAAARNLVSQAQTDFQNGQYQEAVNLCNQALEIQPGFSEAQKLRSQVLETMRILGLTPRPTPSTPGGQVVAPDPNRNEISAVGLLRSINTLCVVYSATYGGFPPSLASLGPPGSGNASAARADLLDSVSASGFKNGYTFIYRPGQRDARGFFTTYTIVARPQIYGRTRFHGFFTDQSGVIRGTSQDREATVNDPPL